MKLTHQALREKFSQFWSSSPRDHKPIPPAPLVLKDDATTLFTSSGMQQLIVNLAGGSHPQGNRLFDIQPCFRSTDIDEVGDNRHTTFFEMMGNWSLGDYFKEEQLEWCWGFFTKELALPKEKLYVTVFEGGNGVPKDQQSVVIWKKLGVPDSHIFYYSADKNWWSRAGAPDQMPEGEIGGPDSEVFYEFDTPHDPKFGQNCHPNCDCGRFLEIGNSVFIQYRKEKDGSLSELPQKNVDYGGGLGRILMAVNNQPDVFLIDVFSPIIQTIEKVTGKQYIDEEEKKDMRIIADHLKGATMMLAEGVEPANKMQGYMVRRLLRRIAIKLYDLEKITNWDDVAAISDIILDIYDGAIVEKNEVKQKVTGKIQQELNRFIQTLDRGMKEIAKLGKITEDAAFDLYQSYGFPFEITAELATQKGVILDKRLFEEAAQRHADKSRSTSSGMFKGGLADHSEKVIKYHTATHLLHQALRDVLGSEVRQEGSNITGDRLRFDFSFSTKPTDDEIKKIESIINDKIKEALPVHFEIMPKEKADQIGALSFFKEKYGSEVKVYFVGGSTNSPQAAYSKEFCGGPHVKSTSEIGSVKITKLKKIGANLMRVYAE